MFLLQVVVNLLFLFVRLSSVALPNQLRLNASVQVKIRLQMCAFAGCDNDSCGVFVPLIAPQY